MKVLLVNGSPKSNSSTFTALSEVAAQLQKHGIETEFFQLGKEPVRGCTGCYGCTTKGKCVFDDRCNELAALAKEADGFVFGSPVYYAGANGALCALLDRAFFSSGAAFTNKPGAAVVVCRRGGASAAFDRLNKYFTINHMPVVPSQYWNSVHGTGPDEVKQDLEGMQTMRAVADNMAWMLKSFDAAKATVALPEREERDRTNFIR